MLGKRFPCRCIRHGSKRGITEPSLIMSGVTFLKRRQGRWSLFPKQTEQPCYAPAFLTEGVKFTQNAFEKPQGWRIVKERIIGNSHEPTFPLFGSTPPRSLLQTA